MAEESSYTLNCPACGSSLVFQPESGHLRCPSCKTEYAASDFSQEEIVERPLLACLNDEELDESAEHLRGTCPNCAGVTEFGENVVSGFCQYCKSPLVASDMSTRTIRPQGLVPFTVSRELAEKTFKSWLSGLWFLPGAAKKEVLSSPMTGIYRPLWTIDFRAYCDYSGRRGDYYYVTESRRVNGRTETRRVRRTHWTNVSGHVSLSFDDLLVYGSHRLSPELQAGLSPWDLSEATDYCEDRVLGFVEESYDLPLRSALDNARQQARPQIDASVERDIGGDCQRISHQDIWYDSLTYKLLLIPYWQGSFHYGKKEYVFAVNGRSGKAHGERPYSALKIACTVFLCAAVAFGVYWLYSQGG